MPLNCDRRFSRNVSITRLDLLSYLDGFCLIVSFVKAQRQPQQHIVLSILKGQPNRPPFLCSARGFRLPAGGRHKVLFELADPTHKVISSETVKFTVPKTWS